MPPKSEGSAQDDRRDRAQQVVGLQAGVGAAVAGHQHHPGEAARSPEPAYAYIRTRRAGMPVPRAPSALPPTASRCVPMRMRNSRNAVHQGPDESDQPEPAHRPGSVQGDRLQEVRGHRNRVALRQEQRDAADDAERPERDDEVDHPEVADQETVDQPDEQAAEQRSGDADGHRVTVAHGVAEQRRRPGQVGADGEVDAGDDDGELLTERQDHEDRRRDEQVADVVGRQEVGRRDEEGEPDQTSARVRRARPASTRRCGATACRRRRSSRGQLPGAQSTPGSSAGSLRDQLLDRVVEGLDRLRERGDLLRRRSPCR